MIALLWKCWDFLGYLLRPEGDSRQRPARRLAGTVKTLFWAAVAVCVGIELGRTL